MGRTWRRSPHPAAGGRGSSSAGRPLPTGSRPRPPEPALPAALLQQLPNAASTFPAALNARRRSSLSLSRRNRGEQSPSSSVLPVNGPQPHRRSPLVTPTRDGGRSRSRLAQARPGMDISGPDSQQTAAGRPATVAATAGGMPASGNRSRIPSQVSPETPDPTLESRCGVDWTGFAGDTSRKAAGGVSNGASDHSAGGTSTHRRGRARPHSHRSSSGNRTPADAEVEEEELLRQALQKFASSPRGGTDERLKNAAACDDWDPSKVVTEVPEATSSVATQISQPLRSADASQVTADSSSSGDSQVAMPGTPTDHVEHAGNAATVVSSGEELQALISLMQTSKEELTSRNPRGSDTKAMLADKIRQKRQDAIARRQKALQQKQQQKQQQQQQRPQPRAQQKHSNSCGPASKVTPKPNQGSTGAPSLGARASVFPTGALKRKVDSERSKSAPTVPSRKLSKTTEAVVHLQMTGSTSAPPTQSLSRFTSSTGATGSSQMHSQPLSQKVPVQLALGQAQQQQSEGSSGAAKNDDDDDDDDLGDDDVDIDDIDVDQLAAESLSPKSRDGDSATREAVQNGPVADQTTTRQCVSKDDGDNDDDDEFSDCDVAMDDALFDDVGSAEPAVEGPTDPHIIREVNQRFFKDAVDGYHQLRVSSVTTDPAGETRVLTCDLMTPSSNTSNGDSEPAVVKCQVLLRGIWFEMPVCAGDNLNVVEFYQDPTSDNANSDRAARAPCSGDRVVIVDDDFGLAVLHPEFLLSPSRVSQCFPCMRKAVLGEVSPSGAPSVAAVMGTLKHEMFDRLLQADNRQPSSAAIALAARQIVLNHLDILYAVDLKQSRCEAELRSAGRLVKSWMREHLGLTANGVALRLTSRPLEDRKAAPCSQLDSQVQLLRAKACEESVWSPKWGLKGFIDATMQVCVTNATPQVQTSAASLDPHMIERPLGPGFVRKTLPLELKTGRQGGNNALSHHAQLQLYSLMLADRYPHPSNSEGMGLQRSNGVNAQEGGLLLYISTKAAESQQSQKSQVDVAMEVVALCNRDVRELIYHRNRMADYLNTLKTPTTSSPEEERRTRAENPWGSEKAATAGSASPSVATPLLSLPASRGQAASECSRCYQREVCTLMHAAVEGGSQESSGMPEELWQETTAHLGTDGADISYYKHWIQLVFVEMYTASSSKREILSMSGRERERHSSDCLADMTCVGVTKTKNLLTFRRVGKRAQSSRECSPGDLSFTGASASSPVNSSSGSASAPTATADSPLRDFSFDSPHSKRVKQKAQTGDLRTATNIKVGDRVILSVEWFDENEQPDMPSSAGVALNCTDKGLTGVPVRRPLHTVYGIAIGTVKALQKDSIKLQVRTHIPAEFTSNGADSQSSRGSGKSGDGMVLRWRLDKDEFFSSMRLAMDNVTRLFAVPGVAATKSWDKMQMRGAGSAQASPMSQLPGRRVDDKRRRLVVHLDKPKFFPTAVLARERFPWSAHFKQPPTPSYWPFMSGTQLQRIRTALSQEFNSMNSCQQRAVCQALAARDYMLVEGMPGTGKTRLISFLVRVLLFLGKSVLVASYTNTGVDNLLMKIVDDACADEPYSIVRIGTERRVHRRVRRFCIERRLRQDNKELGDDTDDDNECSPSHLSTSPLPLPTPTVPAEKDSAFELQRYINLLEGAHLVATTCLGVRHPLFDRRRFDFCIVDEAGQITEPVVLGPLRACDTFVLVGDHKQLPPLVKNPRAIAGGMDVSLFKRLCDTDHEGAKVALTHQYRMNEDIMSVCNALVYDGALCCGTAEVASRALQLPHIERVYALRDVAATLNESTGLPESDVSAPPGGTVPSGNNNRQPSHWIASAICPKRAVVFLDIEASAASSRASSAAATPAKQPLKKSSSSSSSSRLRRAWSNMDKPEAYAARSVVRALVLAGVAPADIGLISPYRNQLKLLRRAVGEDFQDLETMTVDSYQGRDKEVIILSLVCPPVPAANNKAASTSSGVAGTDKDVPKVESPASGRRVGSLLRDKRRLNVAVTRAKSKLIILGSAEALAESGVSLLQDLIGLAQDKNWIVKITGGAEKLKVPLPEGHGNGQRKGSAPATSPASSASSSSVGVGRQSTPMMVTRGGAVVKVFRAPSHKRMRRHEAPQAKASHQQATEVLAGGRPPLAPKPGQVNTEQPGARSSGACGTSASANAHADQATKSNCASSDQGEQSGTSSSSGADANNDSMDLDDDFDEDGLFESLGSQTFSEALDF